ncbi:hypothetical protein [Roseovarius sp. M141]|uniref:hypothetical protein n=1 Tax=Roseovarius sp. M141 TaxID=2583806 RepID=UPI0020CDB4B1|nr:hypothetical protein [Roseovarius sp. M141]MCQ0092910.1 hypothetical protein [Roseovarius sp. M141]
MDTATLLLFSAAILSALTSPGPAFIAMTLTTTPMRRGYVRLESKFDRGAALPLGAMAARIAI